MGRIALGVSVVTVLLSWDVATAQPPPWAGGPPPVGQLYGYSPLVHSIDPFPTRTSGYAPSIFALNGGKRIYPLPVANTRPPVVVIQEGPLVLAPGTEPGVLVGPVVQPPSARWRHRFGR